jgi:hypothetical protein
VYNKTETILVELHISRIYKKSLRIPKDRRTDNTMTKKKDKRTNTDLQNIHIKLKIE